MFGRYLFGTWDLNHDGWRGQLVLREAGNSDLVDGSCTYRIDRFDGTWTSGPNHYAVLDGVLGGYDAARRAGEACPASDHRVVFKIAFPGLDPQRFEGYIFTRDRRRMAGTTWWKGIPFAWAATKL